MSKPSPASWSRRAVTALALTLAPLACDPGDDLEPNDPALEEVEEGVETIVGDKLAPPPPTSVEEAGKAHAATQDLAAPIAPAAGWIAAVSEETPPATCDSDEAVIGSDCMGAHCDHVQFFCGSHGGTPGDRWWTDWFSEEDQSWRVCPGTEYVTGVACRGPWCDDISIECTDLGLVAQGCQWSSWFRSEDPVFFANSSELVAGVQCKGAYCEEMRFFRCGV